MVSPTRSRLSSETADRSSQVLCQQSKSKSIRSIAGTPRWRNGMWSSSTPPAVPAGNVAADAGPVGRARAARATGRGLEYASRGIDRSLSPTKSSRTIRSTSSASRRAATLLPRSPFSSNSPGPAPRGLSSPSKKTNSSVGPDRARLDLAREPERDRRAGRAVVRADEAGDVLRVVVRADEHDAIRVAAGHLADHVAQAVGHPLVAAVRDPPLQIGGELARRRRAGRPLAEADLVLEHLPRARRVEPVLGRGSAPVGAVSAASLHATSASGAMQHHAKSRTPRLWPLWSAHGDSAQGPAELGRRVVPPPGGARLPHARRGGADLRGPAARARGLPRPDRLAAPSRAALPPEARLPALRDGPAGLDRRPALQPRLPRAAHRAPRRPAASSSCACSPAGSSPSASTARSRSGRCGSCRGSRTTASR